jgi:hypothetical protein
MTIFTVTDTSTETEFLKVPALIYQDDSQWIHPIESDVRSVFDPQKNKFFRFGKTERWVLLNQHDEPIGRIAAFVYKKYRNKGDAIPVGGIGFFECINHQEAADLLFDNARHWLLQQGMQAMDGPINFGERDKWWGLLVEGFHSPLYGMNYNPPYYQTLFEQYGFRPFYDQLCMGLDLTKPLSVRISERHALIANDEAFLARHIQKNDLKTFAAHFTQVYNKAWAGHGGMKELSYEHALLMFKKMKPVMDERIIWFAYHHNQPIAMFINLPDINRWFKHLNGKMGIWQKLQFLWLKYTVKNTKMVGLVFGVIPEFQGKGVDSFIIHEAKSFFEQKTPEYVDFEMQWIGDFNPKMLNIAYTLGDTYVSRKLTTYRYLFDRTAPFERHPVF